jgi:hypothetical protein
VGLAMKIPPVKNRLSFASLVSHFYLGLVKFGKTVMVDQLLLQ